MSFLTPATTRCISLVRLRPPQRFILANAHTVFSTHTIFTLQTRLKSQSTQPQAAKSAPKPSTLNESSQQKPHPDFGQGRITVGSREDSAKAVKPKELKRSNAQRPIAPESPANDSGTKTQNIQGKKKMLRPGIYTLLAIVGIYGSMAYLDVKLGIPSSDGSHLPERAQLPQTPYLTPTVIREGIVAGWKELDNLTAGMVIVALTMCFTKKLHFQFLKGRFLVTKARPSWLSFAVNIYSVIWFVPGVVYYLDGDVFHTIAFLASVPLLTSYLLRLTSRALPPTFHFLDLSGCTYAALGIYCMVYSTEKVWHPIGLVARLDAREWGLVLAAGELYRLRRELKAGRPPVQLLSLVSFALGLAYVHYHLKHHLWIPLVSEISSTQASDNEVEG